MSKEIEEKDKTSKVEVSVVLPAYNESLAISPVIDDVRAAMAESKYSYEILVVNDQSTDNTAEIAEEKGVRVLTRTRTGGSGASRKTGIQQARGEIIVMLDTDGTYTAADIPKMLAHFPEYDQVNGARTSEQGTLRWIRMPAKWMIRQLACYLTNTAIPDLNTGLKAFKKDVMLKYLWVIPDGFSCVTSMTLAFLTNGYSVKYVPTTYHKRIGKSKFHPIKDALNYIKTVVRMVMYFNPLKVFMPMSFILCGAGVLKGMMSFTVSGSLQESDIIIIMTGIIVAVLGLLADIIVARGRG